MSLFYSRLLWFLLSLFLCFYSFFVLYKTSIFLEFTLLTINRVSFSFPVIFDRIRIFFIRVVFLISANVLQLSNLYMEDEVYILRFTHLVILFIASIMALIFIPHITALLLGWDGLGLVSFLLVIFYASNKALGAGMFTALRNRIGDAFILIRIRLIYEFHYHLDIVRLSGQPVGCLCLMVAAITKRAQLPFSGWLPAAIEAPTPVSALVHSSTLVTAGVYLIIRFYEFLSCRPLFNLIILRIGAVTRLFAGIRALVELDLKKVVALSTLSQLGFMIISIGLGYPGLAFFHLVTHAMFKALLFICSGCIIHFHGHAQDVRQIGGIRRQIPVVRRRFCVSSFSLCAVPFISGFYSKDAILECFYFSPFSMVIIIISIFSTIFTSMYSTRLLLVGVLGPQKSSRGSRFCEPVVLPIVALRMGAIIAGRIILSGSGPFALEPFNCNIKTFFRRVLVIGPFLAFSFGIFPKVVHNLAAKAIYYASGAIIFFLSPFRTQKFIRLINAPSRSMSYRDQSWLEGGQSNIFSRKITRFINFLVGSGLIVIILFFRIR